MMVILLSLLLKYKKKKGSQEEAVGKQNVAVSAEFTALEDIGTG